MNYVIYIIKYMIYIIKIYDEDIIKALEVRFRQTSRAFLFY